MTSTTQIRVVVNLDVEPDGAQFVAARFADALCSALDGRVTASVAPVLRALPQTRSDAPALRIWTRRRIVERGGVPVELTRLEYDLLLYFCTHPHVVHTRSDLMENVWGLPGHPSSRTVDVHVRRLRTKIGAAIPLLTTVRGVGYRVDDIDLYQIENGDDVGVAKAG